MKMCKDLKHYKINLRIMNEAAEKSFSLPLPSVPRHSTPPNRLTTYPLHNYLSVISPTPRHLQDHKATPTPSAIRLICIHKRSRMALWIAMTSFRLLLICGMVITTITTRQMTSTWTH